VHALRHTVATLLHKSGNKIEDISVHLGLCDLRTTQIYIDRTMCRPHERMAIPWLKQSGDMTGLRLSATCIAAVAQQSGCGAGPGECINSSSSSSSTLGSVMQESTQQQQQLVLALTRMLADREADREHLQLQLRSLTDTYNFIVGEVLTDAQRLTLGGWMRAQADTPEAPIAAPWQETLKQTYADAEPDDTESEVSDDE
jgi:hypothetical protein